MRDKLSKENESVSILSNNDQKHLGIRQQRGTVTGIAGSALCTTISMDSNPVKLER